MAKSFELDAKKTTQENIQDFLAHIEEENPLLGEALRKNIDKILPLPLEPTKRSAARLTFNSEIRKLLDAAMVILKAKNG